MLIGQIPKLKSTKIFFSNSQCPKIIIENTKNSEVNEKKHVVTELSQNKENISNNSSMLSYENIPNICQSYSHNFSNKLFSSLVGKTNTKNTELSLYYNIGIYNKSYSTESGKQENNAFDLPKISKNFLSNSHTRYSSSSKINKIKKQSKNSHKSTKIISGFNIHNISYKQKLIDESLNKLVQANKHYPNNTLSKFNIDSNKDITANLLLKNHFICNFSNNKSNEKELNSFLNGLNNKGNGKPIKITRFLGNPNASNEMKNDVNKI